MGRPALEALAAQQEIINGLKRTVAKQDLLIDYIAKVAGLTPQVTAIRKKADALNPAQPVEDPPSQPATETTEQAATPEAYDDPQALGQTPGSVTHLPADATGTPMDPGTTLPTAPYNELVNVQAPVAGTETHVPYDQTRTEVDVRVGNPMNPQVAYPWTTASRGIASMHLAQLRLQAGTADGDQIQVAASIEGDQGLTSEAIAHEIDTLSGVVKAASRRTQRPAGVVPRAQASVGRTTPSLVPATMQTEASAQGGVAADMENADLFM